jgi:hypothetical protein
MRARQLFSIISLLLLVILGMADRASAVFDSTLGRWITRDPIEDGVGTHLYEYVESSPINRVDPDGLTPKGPQPIPIPPATPCDGQACTFVSDSECNVSTTGFGDGSCTYAQAQQCLQSIIQSICAPFNSAVAQTIASSCPAGQFGINNCSCQSTNTGPITRTVSPKKCLSFGNGVFNCGPCTINIQHACYRFVIETEPGICRAGGTLVVSVDPTPHYVPIGD